MRKNSSNPQQIKYLWLAPALIPFLAGVASAQPNVLLPSDPIIASSANSPGSEGVGNAIDGTQAKYLNFDSAATGFKPSGFVVTPSVGATWVTGLAMESANDAPERDPAVVTLEGSSDPVADYTTGTWTIIATINVPLYTNRYQWQSFTFTNFAPYLHYRWTVTQCAGPNQNSMQIAEVQILGVTVPKNLLQPSDAILASSANSPGSEGVGNAIDGTQAKYLNFDSAATGFKTSGFVVTPQVGATVAQGLSMESANDAPERDPSIVTLEGSDDDSPTWTTGNWTLISSNAVPLYTNRYQFQTFLFPNVTPYLHYRWTVLACAGPNQNSMQIAEVQVLGASAPANIILPSDPIIASSANSPGSEGVANAIDGTQAKYLNFDSAATGFKTSGFVVTPSVGATTITGLGMESANDAPERDPSEVTVEGSNDDGASYTSGTWTQIADIHVPLYTNRYQWQYFYFPNSTSYKSYRWTVLSCAGPNQNSMQIAEVQLLAITSKADCTKAGFVSTPVETPVLNGSQAQFFTEVNGPWPLQWYTNGVAVAGANQGTFTTDPITAVNASNTYSVAIVGCQTSPPVHAVVFTPSTNSSFGIHFVGGGANGAPTYILPEDIVGVQQQAYWINATGASGSVGDGTSLPDALNDSSNNTSTITFTYQTSGTWGAGVGSATPTERMLNGVAGDQGQASPPNDQTMTFGNVPAGSHALLIYSISPPKQFQEVAFTCTNGATPATIYQRTMNADEYKPAPGFYRSISTSSNAPSIGDFIRFDGLHPDASGNITLLYDVLTAAGQQSGVNAIQLVLNAPNPGSPPVITQQPQPAAVASNGVATISVTATGTGLTYQWRKNGYNLFNGGTVSGANTATLTISPFGAADEAAYDVAIFNAAGSTVSDSVAAYIFNFNINDALVGHWPYDESSGNTASNTVAGGLPVLVSGTAAWKAGQIANALAFDGSTTYGLVSNYTKATTAIAGSTWVNVAAPSGNMTLFRNMEGDFRFSGGGNVLLGQFSLELFYDGTSLFPVAAVGLGNNYVTNYSGIALTLNTWHNVAFSADGAQLRLYVDGKLASKTGYTGNINTPSENWIAVGGRIMTDTTQTPPVLVSDTANPNLLNGSLDDMGLWARALTDSEVSAIYQAGLNGKSLTSIQETPSTQRPTLTAVRSGNNLIISWAPAGGTLQSAPALVPTGSTWTTVGTANPATVPIGTADSFFRVSNP